MPPKKKPRTAGAKGRTSAKTPALEVILAEAYQRHLNPRPDFPVFLRVDPAEVRIDGDDV